MKTFFVLVWFWLGPAQYNVQPEPYGYYHQTPMNFVFTYDSLDECTAEALQYNSDNAGKNREYVCIQASVQ